MTIDLKALAAPFPADAISWRAQNVKADGSAALALAYLTARDVMDRLDDVLGPANWQDRYEVHGEKTICYLSVRVDGEWIVKADGGGDSDVEGEKGALSGALKRAAVKWGVGRYLYDLGNTWVDCESYEKGGKKYWKRWKVDPWTKVRNARNFLPANSGAPASRPEPDLHSDNSTVADTHADDLAKSMLEFIGTITTSQRLEKWISDQEAKVEDGRNAFDYLSDDGWAKVERAFKAKRYSFARAAA